MKAKITVGTEEITIDIQDERNFRNCIDKGTLYEYTDKGKRLLINTKNISSVVLDSPVSEATLIKMQAANAFEAPSPEEIRRRQEAMQPDLHKFEAKAKAMKELEEEDRKKKESVMSQVAKIVSGKF